MNHLENSEITSQSVAGVGRVPLVYIVILNYNGAQMTVTCVHAVLKMEYPSFRVLVVDNASTDDSVALMETAFANLPVELLLNSQNEGYTGGNNRGIEKALAAGADYILILNNDTVVNRGCLSALVEAMEREPKLGIAGCPTFDVGPDPSAKYSRRANLFTGHTWWNGLNGVGLGEFDYISGAAFLIRAETVRRVGMFDSRFFLECEDIDLCLRVRQAGYELRIVSTAGVHHVCGHTVNRYRPLLLYCYVRNRAWVTRRHGSMKHRIVFNLYSFCYWYPRIILGRFIRREWNCVLPILRGIREGHCAYPGAYFPVP